jgi:transcriptional regulator with XRE-family HTH domain
MSEFVSESSAQLGARLLEERLRLGLTQEEFAALGGVKLGAQYLYEKGKRSPNADYLVRLRAAGVDLAYVLGLKDVPHSKKSGLAEKKHNVEEMIGLFSQADRECRDQNGALLEFGYRYDRFKKLVGDYFMKGR